MSQEIFNKYEECVKDEDGLILKIATYEDCITLILNFVFKKADSIHIPTAEEIVSTLFEAEKNLLSELLHLKFRKKIMASKVET